MSRILIVEDNKLESNHMTEEITRLGHAVHSVTTGKDAMRSAVESPPDIILLDLILPDMTGYDVCRTLRTHEKTSHVPIILLTIKGAIEDKVAGLGCGANDYITKPYNINELKARMEACLRVKGDLDKLIRDKEETIENLTRAVELSVTDPLTGIFNRRYSNDILAQEFHRFQRYGSVFSFMMIDADSFKKINDSFGHNAGDKVLLELIDVIRTQIRDVDVLSRWGGDEFSILLPQSPCDVAVNIARRILNAVRQHAFSPLAGGKDPLTITIGVAGLPNLNISDGFQMIAAADLALIRAKHKGKDNIEVATDKDVVSLMPIP
jgi:diguanylate cyclase (GGDEF)-like protein